MSAARRFVRMAARRHISLPAVDTSRPAAINVREKTEIILPRKARNPKSRAGVFPPD